MYAETQRCAATVKCNAVTHPLAAIDLSERWAPLYRHRHHRTIRSR